MCLANVVSNGSNEPHYRIYVFSIHFVLLSFWNCSSLKDKCWYWNFMVYCPAGFLFSFALDFMNWNLFQAELLWVMGKAPNYPQAEKLYLPHIQGLSRKQTHGGWGASDLKLVLKITPPYGLLEWCKRCIWCFTKWNTDRKGTFHMEQIKCSFVWS